ncbi:MAG TPA: hypothetical protein VKG01_01285, partial [Thermoanaerobaculia bacterium]|nr:hypothetical protein [Thermoanaerobaculia bacterium]
DVAFCRHLIEKVGVAAIPPSAFYENTRFGKSYVRFAFCKKEETLREAVRRLAALRRYSGSGSRAVGEGLAPPARSGPDERP